MFNLVCDVTAALACAARRNQERQTEIDMLRERLSFT
jgi:hypothetical protein